MLALTGLNTKKRQIIPLDRLSAVTDDEWRLRSSWYGFSWFSLSGRAAPNYLYVGANLIRGRVRLSNARRKRRSSSSNRTGWRVAN